MLYGQIEYSKRDVCPAKMSIFTMLPTLYRDKFPTPQLIEPYLKI